MPIKINGIDEREQGVWSKIVNFPLLPEPKIVKEELATRDGDLDFSEVNSDGHMHYKNRSAEIELGVEAYDRHSIGHKLSRVASWISKPKIKLKVDNIPGVHWIGRLAAKLDVQRIAPALNSILAQFDLHPFSYRDFKTLDGPVLDDEIPIDSNIFIDDSLKYIFEIKGNQNILVPNEGEWYIKPVIRISGNFTQITLTSSDKALTLKNTENKTDFIIDCEKCRVVSGKVNHTGDTSGDFIEHAPGQNSIDISGVNLNCTLSFDFTPLYYYAWQDVTET